MGQYEKLVVRIQQGTADANIPFDQLCELLCHLAFQERIRKEQGVKFAVD